MKNQEIIDPKDRIFDHVRSMFGYWLLMVIVKNTLRCSVLDRLEIINEVNSMWTPKRAFHRLAYVAESVLLLNFFRYNRECVKFLPLWFQCGCPRLEHLSV